MNLPFPSIRNPTFFNFNFGDGINATGPCQVHTYRHAGIYDVILTVMKNDAAHAAMVGNSSVRTVLIVVQPSTLIPHVRAGFGKEGGEVFFRTVRPEEAEDASLLHRDAERR